MTKKTNELFIEEIGMLGRGKLNSTHATLRLGSNDEPSVEDSIQRFEDFHRLAFYKAYVNNSKESPKEGEDIFKAINQKSKT
jgi:hypothetical protein